MHFSSNNFNAKRGKIWTGLLLFDNADIFHFTKVEYFFKKSIKHFQPPFYSLMAPCMTLIWGTLSKALLSRSYKDIDYSLCTSIYTYLDGWEYISCFWVHTFAHTKKELGYIHLLPKSKHWQWWKQERDACRGVHYFMDFNGRFQTLTMKPILIFWSDKHPI